MSNSLLKLKNIDFGKISIDELIDVDKKVNNHDIAIIGVSGRFADADNLHEFWTALVEGKDLIKDLPEVRKVDNDTLLKSQGKDEKGYKYFKGGYLKEIDRFDNELFSIPPKEASLMSPNQRIFLEAAWEAIEDAGYGGNKLSNSRTGVYVGNSGDFGGDYKNYLSSIDPAFSAISIPGNIKSIIASRIAYLLDLKGPSMIVDTACSSSLVAVHLACQAIRNDECDMALAGGVKIYYQPMSNSNQSGLSIASSDSRTKTFDDSSDGTGIGEGVGVIILKSFNRALNDGDSIYAVIKGSAVNQDGSSVGITAPNAAAQEDVIVKAWKEAGVNPETITYIEAHGTGTKLGDPIEISGIKKAFERFTSKKQFCGIGSVKSNIGHLDNASGMAGLIKCILALNHKIIPPTVHFKSPNRKINFEDSPVYVNDMSRKWESDGSPLRCGVSAFGLSGTNCHIILEEAPGEVISQKNKYCNNLNMLAVSAKSKDSLFKLLENYNALLDTNLDLSLDDICYTANTGRGHYSHRMTFIVEDLDSLKEKIKAVLYQKDEIIFQNRICYGEHKIVSSKKENREKGEITEEQKYKLTEEIKFKLNKLLKACQDDFESLLREICYLYSSGADVNWDIFYNNKNHRKVHIPSYPFTRKRFWVDINLNNEDANKYTYRSVEHPLLNRCLSESFDRITYQSEFSVDNYWVLNEHKVAGAFVVPGTTYLEMIVQAGRKLFPESNIELKNTVFIMPLSANEEEMKEVQTIINLGEEYHQFVIVSKNSNNGKWEKHAEGHISVLDVSSNQVIDIQKIKKQCTGGELKRFSNAPGAGVETGARWKCTEDVYIGNNEYLASISIPQDYLSDMDSFIIHPALMDVAANLAIKSIGEGLYLPWTYKSIKMFGRMPEKFYSYIKRKDNRNNHEVATFDIVLADKSGKVFSQIEDYSIKKVNISELKLRQINQNMYYEIGWIKEDRATKNSVWQEGTTLVFQGTSKTSQSLLTRLCNEINIIRVEIGSEFKEISKDQFIIKQEEEDYKKLFESVKDRGITRIIHMMSMTEYEEINSVVHLSNIQSLGILSLFNIAKGILQSKLKGNIELTVISDYANEVTKNENIIKSTNAALFGITKVIGQEYANMKCRCIDIDNYTDADTIISEVKEKVQSDRVAFREGTRYIEEFREVDIHKLETKNIKIKDEGLYVITGGTGGIGLEVAKYLASKNSVKLALINRSAFPNRNEWDEILLSKENVKLCNKINTIREIEKTGSEVLLYSADVSSEEAITYIINELKRKYGRINGIIHGAGNAGDGFILNKNKKTFENVINPKIKGTWILDKLTEKDNVDFFVMFSSITSILAGHGQGDYAAANAFQDSYASYMQKNGRNSLAINWPAWQETGMAVDYGVNEDGEFFKTLKTASAISLFDEILNKSINRVIISEINVDKVKANLSLFPIRISESIAKKLNNKTHRKHPDEKINKKHINITLKGKSLDEQYTETERFLGEIWGELLGFAEIDVYDEFTQLGGNSIVAVKMESELENRGIEVGLTDIYEYTTIKELASYIDNKKDLPVNQINSNDFLINKNSNKNNNLPSNIDSTLNIKPKGPFSFEPFNDIFYKHCFYNSLFPAIFGFGRQISTFLANDIIIYTECNDETWMGSNISYTSCKPLKQLFDELGVSVYTKTHEIDLDQVRNVEKLDQKLIGLFSKDIGLAIDKKEPLNNLIESIIQATANNRVVIIWVDCFYESIRIDTYNKIHWPHTLLLYGYDEEHHVFKVIEHNHRENLTYKKCDIGVEDIINSYKGFLEYYQVNRDMPTYFELQLSGSDIIKNPNNIDTNDIITAYRISILEKREDIIAGLTFLKSLTNDIKNTLIDEDNLKVSSNQLLNNLNVIINAKQIERYKTAKLFNNDIKLQELINRIIDSWVALRNILVKYTYTHVYNKNVFGYIANQIDNVNEQENEYYKRIFEYLLTDISSEDTIK